MPLLGVGGSAIAVLVATLPNLLGGRSASAHAERMAYVGHGPGVPSQAVDGSRPPARPALRRLPPRQLIPRASVAHRATSVRRATEAHRTTTMPTAAPQQATTTAAPEPVNATRPVTTATVKAGVGATPRPAATVRAAADAARPATASTGSGYVNPLAHASVTAERIDQGVDYGGSGDLTAIGAGQITYVGTSGTGWPGAFIEFRLSKGPDAGRYVFYAEGIVPVAGLQVGQTIRAGQKLATLTGSSGGIEIGWGAGIGTETYAMKVGQWRSGMDDDNVPTASGKSFSALIASLGGPPGKIEG